MLLSLGGHSYEIVKTHLQHLATAAAMNIVRVVRWLKGESHAQTRCPAFVRVLRPVT